MVVRAHSGQRLAGFTLGERLAVGGMAEIYRARDPESRQTVVLKVLLPQHARDAEFVQMLADEARLTSALDHPALVKTLRFVEPETGPPFLVMEHVDGASLAHLLKARAHYPLSAELALGIADRLLAALDYIHGLQDDEGRSLAIVHRDVTPANVLVRRDGAIKLGDFGIARSRLRHARTRTGVVKGTVQYMSPEQICGDDCDARSDVYGVGLILFELLTGKTYIDGEREVDLLRCAEEPPWRPPSRERDGVDPAFDALLQPALAVFPEQRYPNAQAMREALSRCAEKVAVTPANEAAVALWAAPLLPEKVQAAGPAAEPAGAGTSRRAGLFVGLLLVAGLGAGSLWLWKQGGAAPAAPRADARPLALDQAVPAKRVEPPTPDLGLPDTKAAPPDATQPDLKRRPIRRIVRPKVVRRHRRPDAGPKMQKIDDGAAARVYASRYAALRGSLQRRFIGKADLSAVLRSELFALKPKPGAKAPSAEALSRLGELERKLNAITIDRAFVQRKLRRVDARLRALPKDRADLPRLKRDAAQALQAVMDGRLAQANKLLQRLEARLAK